MAASNQRNPQVQEYTISHTGSVLGADNVERQQNQSSPQLETPILSFEGPRKFEWLRLNASRHPTRMIPRAVETFDGDGSITSFQTSGDLLPIAGEPDIEDQPFPVAEVVDTSGNSYDISNVNYSTNTVQLASAPAAGTDNVKVFPAISEGTLKYRGVNQFGQVEGTLSDWGTPIYRFLDFPQRKRGSEVNMEGNAQWSHYEELELVFDSPHQIVWEDADYTTATNNSYVSNFEQKVDIRL